MGDTKEIPINVRVIASTHRDLKTMVEQGLFREDLFYRLNVIPIVVPPLRERREDIPLLAIHFLEEQRHKLKRDLRLSADATEALKAYWWPGNVRELENVIEFAASMTDTNTISEHNLPPRIRVRAGERSGPAGKSHLRTMVHNMEYKAIQDALAIFGSSLAGKKAAARALGISLATLYNKIKKYEGHSKVLENRRSDSNKVE